MSARAGSSSADAAAPAAAAPAPAAAPVNPLQQFAQLFQHAMVAKRTKGPAAGGAVGLCFAAGGGKACVVGVGDDVHNDVRGWDGTSRLTLKTLQYSRLVHEYMVLVPDVAKGAAGGATGAEVPMQGSGGRLLRIVKGGSSEHDEDALFDAQMPKLTVEAALARS